MKRLIIQSVLPLTIISFVLISQWKYVLVVDGPDDFFVGFPLIYKGPGFHTSLSTQYFISEMIFNLIVYFSISLIVCKIINRFYTINIPKKLYTSFWIGFGVFILFFIYLFHELDNRIHLKRDFEVEVIESGFAFFNLQPTERPEIDKSNTP
ncbi:hypothetical protein SAMN04489761_3595 [Tenacibaculum sp. MAR_2009_124]|uniref:hypothetical protein n=1 Tax=Tenacibaculum sp. MAR_2009_124 TaxID=1250059 RepID=UPI00089B0B75|nr:hypothetical protein [Tenacibaculum sp. MAR_2009_124]SEC79162.1 hypothetical protein SAMN04489761_3595 [Tenacibaculum sp. MAR_2009_124]